MVGVVKCLAMGGALFFKIRIYILQRSRNYYVLGVIWQQVNEVEKGRTTVGRKAVVLEHEAQLGGGITTFGGPLSAPLLGIAWQVVLRVD